MDKGIPRQDYRRALLFDDIDSRIKAINLAVFVQHPDSGDILQALSASCR